MKSIVSSKVHIARSQGLIIDQLSAEWRAKFSDKPGRHQDRVLNSYFMSRQGMRDRA